MTHYLTRNDDPTEHMSEDQRRVKKMEEAGIGRIYHDESLMKVGGDRGERLKEWLLSHANKAVKEGWGLSLYGEGTGSYEAFMLLARGMVLLGGVVRVVSLPRLVYITSRRWDTEEEWALDDWSGVLFLTRFYEKGKRGCPLTRLELHRVEGFLEGVHDRGLSVFYQGTSAMRLWPSWWGEPLTNRVEGVNEDFEI